MPIIALGLGTATAVFGIMGNSIRYFLAGASAGLVVTIGTSFFGAFSTGSPLVWYLTTHNPGVAAVVSNFALDGYSGAQY